MACLISLLWLTTSYLKAQRALQWWFQRQSMQLSYEAEKIQNGLLQESFSMRRSLEVSIVDNIESTQGNQDWLKKIEKLNHSLEQLSDRLSPAYLEDSLPLAIQYVAEHWRKCNPRLKIEMELPTHWRNDLPDRSLVVLRVLDELLRITTSELLADASIHISLKMQGNIGELSIHVSYPDLARLISYSNLKDLEYLSLTFRFLTSGQCYRRRKNLTLAWHFKWAVQKELIA